jgi:tripartite-type tricarboxylate transporter receptor subunit TctC
LIALAKSKQGELAFASAGNGKLRALAVTGPRRSPVLPDLPTLSETGLPGFSITSWFALFAPAGTPAKILIRLNKEAGKAIASKELRQQWMAQGIEPAGGTSEQLAAFRRIEAPKWGKIVSDPGARVE